MIREKIKQVLCARRTDRYEKELADKEASYANWYRTHKRVLKQQLEEKDHTAGEKLTMEVVRYSHLRSYILSGEKKPDIIIACDDDGNLSGKARTLISDFFAENPRINLVYGDEDRIDENGDLCDPWMKPDWSPDTFLSTFYFGSIFAFRSEILSIINPQAVRAQDVENRAKIERDSEREKEAREREPDDVLRTWIYGKLCLRIAQADGGFEKRHKNRFPIGHIREILFHAAQVPEPWDSRLIRSSLTGRYSSASAATRLISIIIPSKDNPEILARCIQTIEQYTISSPYELVIVDNGSTPENQKKIRAILEKHNEYGSASYLYQEMPFNFSRMCNLGAQRANGELLLFLNDDIEIRKPGWLSYLSEKAKLPYVGAVGMKLLYPGSDIIQHAGVVNVRLGPIHKLQFCDNRDVLYFGYNKGVRNVIAVTGACLMVRANLFKEIGGFDEEKFAVAFNDIDLCYRIYEKGYYNVVRNNMYLYHHESLSRGDDRKDKVKSLRLSQEQENLLRAHPDLFGQDPFYHPYMTQNPAITTFEIGIEDAILEGLPLNAPVKRTKALPDQWFDPVLRLGVEGANSLQEYYRGPFAGPEEKGYYVRGYSFVINADNANYDRTLLLRAEDGVAVYEVPVDNVYRPDIARNLTDQIHDKLTGFACVIPAHSLPAGSYVVGMLAQDKTGRGRIAAWSDVHLKMD
ncbi:MAG: glycosyltransferase [Lachnospiraceae bacterium]|nr:glycosyltransferase [Lachnospiraceae bacterium]